LFTLILAFASFGCIRVLDAHCLLNLPLSATIAKKWSAVKGQKCCLPPRVCAYRLMGLILGSRADSLDFPRPWQRTVLRRQRPGQLRFFFTDRLLGCDFTGWPQVLTALVLVKPATVAIAS
jgi:hypothetical protein